MSAGEEVFGRTACFLARDEEGEQTVCVLVKRTFAITGGHELEPCEEQAELVDEDEFEAKETEPGSYPVAESEIVPYKLRTDVVVTGEAVAPDGRPTPEGYAGVEVGSHRKYVKVFGDREIRGKRGGSLRFTAPEPYERIPLTWDRAYGGVDPSVPRNEDPETVGEWLDYLSLVRHPGVYPRNPVGRAYVVNAHAWLLNERPLPNFEDPDDLLTPARVIVEKPTDWWRQPLPAGLGWFGRSWYPRAVLGGLLPPFPPPDETAVPEVAAGIVPPDHVSAARRRTTEEGVDPLFFNGASPGLAVPLIRGDEPVRLLGLDATGERRFRLPGVRPEVRIACDGEELDVAVRLHTLWIRADEDRVWIVWSANARTPERLPRTLPTREEPEVDELEGVEIHVDGAELSHEPVDLGTAPF